MPTGARGVEKGESDMHLYGTKRDRSERVVCCFPLYKLKILLAEESEDASDSHHLNILNPSREQKNRPKSEP